MTNDSAESPKVVRIRREAIGYTDFIGFTDISLWFSLGEVKSRADLLSFVYYFAGSRMFSKEHIRQFIEAVCEYHGWRLNVSPKLPLRLD
jgi:hypothetical protein